MHTIRSQNFYNFYRTCPAKVNRQKLLKSSRDLKAHIDQADNLDSRKNRSSNNINSSSRHDNVANKVKTKQSKKEIQAAQVTRDIIAENITKQGKKLRANPVRIPATSNLVYEFNPFGRVERTNSLTSRVRSQSTHNSDQGVPAAKTDTARQPKLYSNSLTLATSTLNRNSGLAKRKTSALPELNLRADFITDDLNSIVTNANRDARLPILSKEDQTRISSKRLNDRHKQCNIDCEVESTWRAFREGRDWTKEKARIDNTCTTKWSEVIEKMTRDMDKIQKRYLNPRANRYLYKSATNVLKTAPDINRSRNFDINMISKDMAQTRFDKATKNISTDEHSNENLLLSQFTTKTRSIHTNAYARNIDNDIGSVHTIANNCDEKQHASVTGQTFKDDGAKRTSIKAPIHEYLQNCIDEVRKLPNIEEDKAEERLRDIKPLANDIANILTSLDIGSFEFYEDLEKRDHICGDTQESAREDSEEPNIATNITQIMPVDTIRRNKIVNENASPENNSEFIDAKTAGTSKQSNTTDCEDNFAFIKIGLNVQNKNVPKDKLSQILQSEYLRKDLFL